MRVDWRTPIEHRLPLVWSGVLFLVLVAWYGDWGFDDPFITYRYARNLARGMGLVYTPGERVLSTTSPFWTLLLAPIAQMGLPIPSVAVFVGIVALSLSTYLLGALGRQWQTPMTGFCAMFVFPLLPAVRQSLGSELPVLIFLGLAALSTATRGRPHVTALLLALAALTRTDALLLALLIAVLGLVRRQVPLGALALFTFPLALWHGWAWWFYGSPLPSTLGTKQAQARMAISHTFAEGLVEILTRMAGTPGGLFLLALLLVGIGSLWWHPRRRMWGMLVGWGFLHSAGYAWLQVSRYYWYYVPLMLAIAAAIGCGAALIVRRLPARWRTGVWGLCMLWSLLLLWQQRTQADSRIALYTQTGRWLAAHTPANATIGTLEVGIVGYYADRPIVDFAGLLQPELSTLMFYDTNYDLLAIWAFARHHPDYVVIRDDTLAPLRNAQLFHSTCHLEQTIRHPSTPRAMFIYACQPKSDQS